MTSRVWANGTGIAISAANMNGIEGDLDLALGVPDLALASRVVAGTTKTALDLAYATAASVAAKVAKGDLVISVKDYGAVGDGVANDGVPIQNAVNAALAANRELYWPAGTYLKTVNTTSFHLVKHIGAGIVKHGSDLFYVQPVGAQTNKLYIATTGSDTNDGIGSALPIRRLVTIAGFIANYGPILQGFWTIQLAAGTYTDRSVIPIGLDSVNAITVQGPIVNHPNVPTVHFTEGYNIGAVAIKMVDVKSSFIFSNIKFTGYNGTSSSAGIQSSSVEGTVYTVNCHFTDCYWGFSNQDGDGDMKGGIALRCGLLGDTANNLPLASRNGNGGGYRGLMHSRHSIGVQNAGVNTNGPYFQFCRSGVFAQESCTGHVDWAVLEDCDFGVNLNVSSRANVDGSLFQRNAFDLKGLGNSHFYVASTTQFGTGANESQSKISLLTGSQMTDDNRMFTNINQSYSATSKIFDTTFPNQSIQTTGLTVFYTATLAGNLWRDIPNSTNKTKRVNVKVYGELLGTAGTKNLTMRLGTSNVAMTFTAAEVGAFQAEGVAYFSGQATQFLAIKGYRHLGAGARIAQGAATNAMTANTNLTLEALVGVATDTIRIDAIEMSWA